MSSPALVPEALVAAVEALKALREDADHTLAGLDWTGHSHADLDALAFTRIVMAHVAAVEVLGRTNLHFVLPATAAARSAYEAAITAAWMVAPADPVERDRRWMGLFFEERSFWRVLVAEAGKRNDPPATIALLEAEVERVQRLVDTVQAQLSAEGKGQIAKIPQMDDRLLDVGQERHYVSYKLACQLVHPATRALSQVRDQKFHGDGHDHVRYEYRTRPKDWVTALALSGEAVSFSFETLSQRASPPQGLPGRSADLFNELSRQLGEIARAT